MIQIVFQGCASNYPAADEALAHLIKQLIPGVTAQVDESVNRFICGKHDVRNDHHEATVPPFHQAISRNAPRLHVAVRLSLIYEGIGITSLRDYADELDRNLQSDSLLGQDPNAFIAAGLKGISFAVEYVGAAARFELKPSP